MPQFLHSMIRISDPEATVAFFKLIGVEEVRRFEVEAGRFTLIFLAAPGEEGVAEVELTYNWPPEDGSEPEEYGGGRNFGHIAYRVDDIYATCQKLMDAGVTINR
ncbi:MAG: VOC family protein, partial [Pseudomonadota bacterium]